MKLFLILTLENITLKAAEKHTFIWPSCVECEERRDGVLVIDTDKLSHQ